MANNTDIVFHLLDLQARDIRIEREDEETREVVYESNSESDDDEFISKGRKKNTNVNSQKKEFIIHLFGATQDGRPLRVDVTGFRPSFFIKLPNKDTSKAIDSIRAYISSQRISLADVTFRKVSKKNFYGFTANTYYNFLQVEVGSLSMFRNIKNLFLNENSHPATKRALDPPLRNVTVEVFEANIDPMLRFIHTQNIQPCGWVKIIDGALSIQDKDADEWIIDCNYDEVMPTEAPRVSAPFLTASWDIECFSMTGDFPLAKRTWKKAAKDALTYGNSAMHIAKLIIDSLSITDVPSSTLPKAMTPIYCQLKKPIEQITLILNKPDIQDNIDDCIKGVPSNGLEVQANKLMQIIGAALKNCVKLVGDPVIQIGTTLTRGTADSIERHLFVFPDCDPIDGIEVHAYKTEKEMILRWFEWLIERNPDILIGYNVFGFDEKYLWERAEELGIVGVNSSIHEFSRLFTLGGEIKCEEKFLSSSALGDNEMYIWSTHGRLQIDLYHYVRRSGASLPSYKLDNVIKHYMSGKLKKHSYKDGILTLDVAGAIKDVRAGRAIVLIDDTGESVTDKLVVSEMNGSVITVRCDFDEDALIELQDASKWVIVKDDVGPQDIFRLHRESSRGRAIVGKYCLQDCDLVIELYKKLEVFNNSMSMANVCSVPISYIFTRGQGIKIESLIFKACRERDILIPVLPAPKQRSGGLGSSNSGEDSYEGAIVLDPIPGFYSTSPIGVCDFASLYPSTIVSENISHDSLVWVKDFTDDGRLIANYWGSDEYAECDGYAYTDIEFDIWRPDPMDTRKTPRKIKMGRRICRYAQPLDGSKSTLPQITTWLLSAREAKKKEMKGEKDPERYALLDAEQLAYKLTGNSLYGQLGSGTFKIRLQSLAASVTAYGRKQILFAKDAIEKFYGPEARDPRVSVKCMAKVMYGDSVTGDTPLILRDDAGKVFIKRIDELYSSGWNEYHDTKEAINLQNDNLSVWTERGFTKINRLIRHHLAPNKKLFRINTHTGVVDVTEDHSLVLADGKEAKPNDVKIGTELLHNDYSYKEFEISDTTCDITEDEAFVMGLFVADGSSDIYECASGKKATWAINKADIGLLTTAMNKCPFPTKILNTIESSGVYKLVPVGDIITPARTYRELFYNQHREKRIPDIILNAADSVIKAFWNGFYAGDGDKDNNGYIRFDQKGKEIGAGLYILAKRLGYSVSINERDTKDVTFRYTMTNGKQRKNTNAIKKMRELPHPGDAYVYDLETDNHHFAVGPGALIVHNTDSLFVEFNVRNPETGERLTGREARQATIDITDEAGAFITKVLKSPHDFEFDKAFDPLLMFSKKRYAGNMYEVNADDYVHKYMGIALKRRDNAPIVKTIFGGAMKMLLNSRDVVGATEFIKKSCMDLVEGKVSMGQLTITKSLRADYADPSRIAHKALADRIAARDPGNAPAPGDRIGYVYISAKPGVEVKLQGDKIETPQYVKENKLAPDYRFYVEHQIMNPVSQAFGLLLEQMPGFNPSIMTQCPDDPEKALTWREGQAARLLFDDCLKKYETFNRRNALSSFFGVNTTITVNSTKTTATKSISNSETIKTSNAQTVKKPVQLSMSSYLMDSFVLDSIKKKEREQKRKLKAAAAKENGKVSSDSD